MKIELYGVMRECQIVPAPPGSFAYLEDPDGLDFPFVFPSFVMFAPTVGTDTAYGYLESFVICDENGGFHTPIRAHVCMNLDVHQFKRIMEFYNEDEKMEMAEYVYEEMQYHKVNIHPSVFIEVQKLRYKK